MRYLFVTEPGLEPFVAAEAEELWPFARVVAPGRNGLLRVDLDQPVDPTLRTVQHVAEVRLETEVGSLVDIRQAAARAEFPALVGAKSFRATGHLPGDKARFTVQEIAGAVGAGLQQRYGTKVDLESFAVNVRVDLDGAQLVLSQQLTTAPLGNRIRRGRALRGSIKATVAAAMLRLAGMHRGSGRLLDPLCGAGTIPVEAKLTNFDLQVCASDWDARTLEAARGTVLNHGVDIDLRQADARQPGAVWPGRFDWIVTNPPFGQRLGRRVSLAQLYAELLRGFLEVLEPPGSVVLLTPRIRALERAVQALPVEVVEQIPVDTGGITPRIHLLRGR